MNYQGKETQGEMKLLEITNIISKMKNILDWIKSRLRTAKEEISEAKDIQIETAQNEIGRKKMENEQSSSEL